MQTSIRKLGDKLVVELPVGLTGELRWNSGDIVDVVLADGGLKIDRKLTVRARAMQIARKATERYRETFEALAKS
jgi:antitoxin component of MazEF toxin-antitoxin module